jgi:hypothetical protein
MVGSTLRISTTLIASESVSLALSESVTLIDRVVDAGPSGNVHLKVPPVAEVVSDPAT